MKEPRGWLTTILTDNIKQFPFFKSVTGGDEMMMASFVLRGKEQVRDLFWRQKNSAIQGQEIKGPIDGQQNGNAQGRSRLRL